MPWQRNTVGDLAASIHLRSGSAARRWSIGEACNTRANGCFQGVRDALSPLTDGRRHCLPLPFVLRWRCLPGPPACGVDVWELPVHALRRSERVLIRNIHPRHQPARPMSGHLETLSGRCAGMARCGRKHDHKVLAVREVPCRTPSSHERSPQCRVTAKRLLDRGIGDHLWDTGRAGS